MKIQNDYSPLLELLKFKLLNYSDILLTALLATNFLKTLCFKFYIDSSEAILLTIHKKYHRYVALLNNVTATIKSFVPFTHHYDSLTEIAIN